MYRGLAVLLGFLLMEELAWGQVIFGWQTPESIRVMNAQEETTLHNLGWFQDRLDAVTFFATVVILLLVVVLPRLAPRLVRDRSFQTRSAVMTLLPPTYVWPLFLFVVAMAPALAQTPAEKGLEIAAETDRRDQGFVDIQVDKDGGDEFLRAVAGRAVGDDVDREHLEII